MIEQNKQTPETNERRKSMVDKMTRRVIAMTIAGGVLVGGMYGIGVGVSELSTKIYNNAQERFEQAYDHNGKIEYYIQSGDELLNVIRKKVQAGEIQNPDHLDLGIIQMMTEDDPENRPAFNQKGQILAGKSIFFPSLVKNREKNTEQPDQSEVSSTEDQAED